MSNVPEGAQLSPDGYYWWDGNQWQPVETAAQVGVLQSDPNAPTSYPGDTDQTPTQTAEERSADLDRNFNGWLGEGNYALAAEALNGFDLEDINARLGTLSLEVIAALHQGALDNPRLGGMSQVALATKVDEPAYAEGSCARRFQVFLKPGTAPFTLEIFSLTDDFIGHSWFGIKRNDGKSLTIGFWPDSWTAGIVGAGRLHCDDPHAGEQQDVHTLDQAIGLDEARKILPVIADWDNSNYSLLARNCTDFVVNVWQAVTGEDPSVIFPHSEHPIVWSPALLAADIDDRNAAKALLDAHNQ
jgi:hypothetical protein